MNYFIKILTILSFCFGVSFAAPFVADPSHSEIGFSVRHLMITNVKGNFDIYLAEIDFDQQSKTFKAVSSVIDASSVKTEDEKRDMHLMGKDFFHVKKFSDIKFVMTSYEKIDDRLGKMKGNLTIKGITKPIVLDTQIGGVATFMGQTKMGFMLTGEISRKEFGLRWNKTLETGGVVVGDAVKLIIELEANRKK